MKHSVGSSSRVFGCGPAGPLRGLLSIWLAVYLASAGQLDGQLWARGGHATPEQWATHARLEALKASRHHGPTDAAGPDEQADAFEGAAVVAATLSLGLPLVGPAPAGGASSGSPVHQPGPWAFSSSLRGGTPDHAVRRDDPLLASALPAPPETPPPILG